MSVHDREWRGVPHLLTIESVDEGDQWTEIESHVDHPSSCQFEDIEFPGGSYRSYKCGVEQQLDELAVSEINGIEEAQPGLYLIRDWGRGWYNYEYGMEWDAGLEVMASCKLLTDALPGRGVTIEVECEDNCGATIPVEFA